MPGGNLVARAGASSILIDCVKVRACRLAILVSVLACPTLAGCSEGSGTLQDRNGSRAAGGATNQAGNGQAGSNGLNEEAASEPVPAAPSPLPVQGKHRGFNLTGMYKLAWGNSGGFSTDDFALVHDLGFNFVRLPLDYLTYTITDDWLSFDPAGLAKIDRAVELGQTHGVHVCLNLHQAPGFSVSMTGEPAAQDLNLWTDAEAQRVFVAHWRMFAHRYQQIPPEYLSFNLVNEPYEVDEATYLAVMQPAIDAIRLASPDRPVILDGLEFATVPLSTLTDKTVIQSVHDYNPTRLVFYKAPWVDGSDTWPVPEWPPTAILPQYFFGSMKGTLSTPLTIDGDFPAGTQLSINVHQVSIEADLVVLGDGQQLLEHHFLPGPDDTEATQVVLNSEYDVYQNIYDREYSVTLASSAKQVVFEVLAGDWLTFTDITLTLPQGSGARRVVLVPSIDRWDVPQTRYRMDGSGRLVVEVVPAGYAAYFDWKGWADDWMALKQSGVEVMVGEFAVYNQTPHAATLAWMKDHLALFDDAGLGWSAWSPYGELGFLDSKRADVAYEAYGSHLLDRQMLDLLQAY
jgi:hypothetical protein